MKASTLIRLDLLAAAREAALLETIRRHSAALKQNEHQRGVLDAYRTRLAASWQNGAIVNAAQARGAARFATGALTVQVQILAAEAQDLGQLETALGDLAKLKAHRRKLAESLRDAARKTDTQAETKAERDQPFRGKARRLP